MAALLKLGKPLLNLPKKSIPCISAISRNYAAYWNKDWKPGPYPVTPEERERAAKKYGLRPEDYQPYPDDGTGHGDYPMLPYISVNSRDPYEQYDMPAMKRNYGEPLHYDADILREDCWDPNMKFSMSFTGMLITTCTVIGGIVLAILVMEPYPHFHPIMPKQYPSDLKEGEKHYSFEPVE